MAKAVRKPKVTTEAGKMKAIHYPPTIKIGILVFPNFEPIDVWGFIEAFSIARFIGTDYGDPNACPFEIVLISNEISDRPAASPSSVQSYNGPKVAPDLFRNQAQGAQLQLLMIPGGYGIETLLDQGRDPASTQALLEWVRSMDRVTPIMSSVCTGAAVLAASGVLDGKPAATNHQAFAWVTAFGPGVHWDSVSRWVDAGKYVTSAGVSAGTDMGFYLVKRLCGRAVAEAAALAAEYDWHRDPEQPIVYSSGAVVPDSA